MIDGRHDRCASLVYFSVPPPPLRAMKTAMPIIHQYLPRVSNSATATAARRAGIAILLQKRLLLLRLDLLALGRQDDRLVEQRLRAAGLGPHDDLGPKVAR